MEDKIQYYMTLCRFCNEIVAKKAYELLLKKINKELEKNQAIVKTGVIVDVSITVSSLAPKGGPTFVGGESEGRGEKETQSKKG
ncbi:MAG: hypothetical protein ACMUEL_04890 [Flavobacteriales bacterium Tduv]